MKHFSVFGLTFVAGFLCVMIYPTTSSSQSYEAYFLYHSAYPKEEETSYSGECENNTQGITHDDNNWFISQTYDLWKIPVQHDLRHVNSSGQYPGVIRMRLVDVRLPDGTSLVDLGYFHIGDLSYYKGYVIAPIEAHAPQPHAVVLFRADNLEYAGHALVTGYRDFGWVAVDPQGYLYTSGDFSPYLEQWSVNWDKFPGDSLKIKSLQMINLLHEDGSPFNSGHAQGGVFSPSGDLFYFLSGIHNGHDPDEGINVFDTRSSGTNTWRRLLRSHQGDDYQPFWYHIDPGCCTYEEPEGLTIWDLDDGRAPGIRGQLHVVVLDNDASCDKGLSDGGNSVWYDDDDVTLYHYINTIYVDSSFTGSARGVPEAPFNTIGEAYNLAWNGARIKIQTGSYSEKPAFSKQIQVLAQGGTVRIGTGGQVSLTTSGAINIGSGGSVKLH